MNKKSKLLSLFILFSMMLPMTTSCFYLDEPETTNPPSPSSDFIDYKKQNKLPNNYNSSNLNVRNLGDQLGYKYIPSTGDRKILVVPVETSDDTFTSTELKQIESAFFGSEEDTGWESVASYYEKSSYGKLRFTGEVSPVISLDVTTREFENNYNRYSQMNGIYTDLVLERVLDTLATQTDIDLASYDTDHDQYIDAVWMVYSPKQNSNSDCYWAYTTWAKSTKTFNGVKACNYSWASVDFLDDIRYPVSNSADAHTFIHETGHLLGLDDYYSYDYDGRTNYDTPLGGVDMMDFNIGDHNPFTKYLLQWETPTLISKEYLEQNGNTLTLKPSSSGDSFLIPMKAGTDSTDFSYNYTPYDEYLLVSYYTPTVLNEKDSNPLYTSTIPTFSKPGIMVYHVNAKVGKFKINTLSQGTFSWDGYVYDQIPVASENERNEFFSIIYSNTSSYSFANQLKEFGFNYYRSRLISLLPATGRKIVGSSLSSYANNNSLFKTGESFSNQYNNFVFDCGVKPTFDFKVGNMNADGCSLTFSSL